MTVDSSKIRVDDGGCWLWTGRVNDSGYGMGHNNVAVLVPIEEVLIWMQEEES